MSRVLLQDVISELDEGQDIEILTDLVIDMIVDRYRDTLRDMIWSPIRGAIARYRRMQVLPIERSVRGNIASLRPSVPGTSQARANASADPTAQFRDLFARKVIVPGYGEVTWGQMTVDQHLARAASARKRAMGNLNTAELHEEAVRILTVNNARTLVDLATSSAA